MHNLRFSVQIRTPKEKVWKTLWDDETFRDWANIIDEGTYLVGDLKEGNTVQFLSASGYGVTSHVEECVPNERITFKHLLDTQNSGANKREPEWSGGKETYSLMEQDGMTMLINTVDLPAEQVELFTERLPKALERVRELAEGR